MNENKDNKIMTIVAIVVFILVISLTINNIIEVSKIHQERPTSVATATYMSDSPISGQAGYSNSVGVTRLCINNPPIILNDCNLTNATLNTSLTYNCTFNATDPNGDAIIFQSIWYTLPQIFNITSDGRIDFSPKRAAIGKQNVVGIYAYDNSGCENNYAYSEFNMTVVGSNRPPYLVKPIPDQTLTKNNYFLFHLNDYFADPDDDVLRYLSVTQNGKTVNIKIAGDSVQIKGLDCGISTVYYIAADPYYVTAQSNTVTYDVQCPNASAQQPGKSNEQNEGGGGGGAGESYKCAPNWKCSMWSPCRPENYTSRKCMDYNACNPSHYVDYMFENCTFVRNNDCAEQWDCNEWSVCKNGMHTRICLDLKNCGTNSTKPDESENCTKIATCFNGIQDQGETGIDCGGPCGVCRNTENPSKLNTISTMAVIAGVLMVGISGSLIFLFRKKISNIYRKMFGKKPRIKRKIYINDKQKEKLLQLMNIIQVRINEHKINYAIDESSLFVKEYFKQLLSIDTLDKQQLITKIVKLKDKNLEKLLVMFYAKIINTVHLHDKGVMLRDTEIQELVDEISHEIYLIAEFNDKDAINSIKDRTTNSKEPLDIIYNKLSNLYIALKFGELIAAKEIYKDVLKDYEKLSIKEKIIPYNDIIRAFHAIDYLEELYKK